MLGIGNHRVSTMVDLAPEALALFDVNPFGYAGVVETFAGEFTPPATEGFAAPEPAAAPVAEPPESGERESRAASPAESAADAVAPESVGAEPARTVAPPAPVAAEAAAPAAPREEEEFSDKVSADEAQRITDAYSDVLLSPKPEPQASAPAAEAEAGARRTGPRVLGRIDLSRKPTPAKTAA
ncbi:MAG: hypothetical protein ABR538_18250, partial [Candidatus Binatia bacterium]